MTNLDGGDGYCETTFTATAIGKRMFTIDVTLPDSLRQFVQCRLSDGFGSASEYVRELIRRDQRELERATVEKRLLTALHSRKSAMTARDWKELRGRIGKRRGPNATK